MFHPKCTNKFQNPKWAQKLAYIKTMQNVARGGGDHKNERICIFNPV